MFHLFAEVFLGGTRVACGMHRFLGSLAQIILGAVYITPLHVSVVSSIGSCGLLGLLGLLQDIEALQDGVCLDKFWMQILSAENVVVLLFC